MTPAEIYDWLLANGVKEPAVLKLGTLHVVGRWEQISEVKPAEIGHDRPALDSEGRAKPGPHPKPGPPVPYIVRSGKLAIQVIGQAESWDEAFEQARARLENPPPNAYPGLWKPFNSGWAHGPKKGERAF